MSVYSCCTPSGKHLLRLTIPSLMCGSLMKISPFLLTFLVLLSHQSVQGALQTRTNLNSYGTIYVNQSLTIKRYTINSYCLFELTPEAYAELYDMTEADYSSVVRNNISIVHQIKHNFKALLYWNFRSVENTSRYGMVQAWQACVSNGWLLKDMSGNIIRADVGYFVDIGNSSYQNWIASHTKSLMEWAGYDGIYADNCLASTVGEHFWGTSATPINPRTNQPWTDEEVRQALIDLHKAIKNAIGSKLLCCNGIYSGYRFYQHQSGFQEILSLSPLDGVMSEGMWHPYVHSSNVIWMSETQWQQSVDFLIWIQDNWLSGHKERFYVPVVKLAYGNRNPTQLPSGCTREQMAIYGFASTLLGAKTNQIYFSTFADPIFETQVMKSYYDLDLGAPVNDYYIISGTHVYTRDFTKVKVLVNPTNQQYYVNLGQNYLTLDGQVISELTVTAHTGVILKKV